MNIKNIHYRDTWKGTGRNDPLPHRLPREQGNAVVSVRPVRALRMFGHFMDVGIDTKTIGEILKQSMQLGIVWEDISKKKVDSLDDVKDLCSAAEERRVQATRTIKACKSFLDSAEAGQQDEKEYKELEEKKSELLVQLGTAKAKQHEEALMMISNHEAAVRDILSDYIWGVNEETLESVVGQLLVNKGLSLAVAESFTGGFLINTLSSIPQNYNFFKGGLITTSDDVRVTLGMNPGLVAGKANVEATTAAMASLVRCKMNASIGIGIDGYTELIDNVMTTKVFTAIDSQDSEQPIVRNYSGRNKQVMISRAAYSVLFDLKKLLVPA